MLFLPRTFRFLCGRGFLDPRFLPENGGKALLRSIPDVVIEHTPINDEKKQELHDNDNEHDDIGFGLHSRRIVPIEKYSPKKSTSGQHGDMPIQRRHHTEEGGHEVQNQGVA